MSTIINPFMPNVFSHPYQLDDSISNFRGVGWFSIFIQILKGTSVSKQWRTWSDTAFCGVWSGFALFADVPQKDTGLIWVQVQT